MRTATGRVRAPLITITSEEILSTPNIVHNYRGQHRRQTGQ